LSGRAREKKGSFGVAGILETSSIFERSEVGARWLGRFLISLHDRVTTSVDTGNESKRRSSGCKVVEIQHGGGFALNNWIKIKKDSKR
jgi:hypothetical protein